MSFSQARSGDIKRIHSIASPLLSVIVPIYNVEDHVAAAIASLMDQSFGDFEAILVDDGSTDASSARARAAMGADARFRLISQENKGLSGARNTALDCAQGAYLAFLDSDDRYHAQFLAQMVAALEADGADWVASAIRYVTPGGGRPHSAIHDTPDPSTLAPQRYPLMDWREVIRHFPSAWNKLYRRSLIEGLRFDEGTWYEDHAFFLRAAARTDHLLHLPEPLYLQTQGRPGQITGDGGERVFEQFSVLETMGPLLDSAKPGGAEAFAQIATRLVQERATPLRKPDRRRRFAARANAFFETQGLAWTPTHGQPQSFARVMAGTPPLSIVIPTDGAPGPLAQTLQSLAQSRFPDFELLLVQDTRQTQPIFGFEISPPEASNAGPTHSPPAEGPGTFPTRHFTAQGVSAARNAGRDAARGDFVLFLDAGDRPEPWALGAWVEGMLREGADFGAAGFRMGDAKTPHTGFHDAPRPLPEAGPVALPQGAGPRLHAHPSAKIFRRAFLETQGLRFPPEPLAAWAVTLRAAQTAKTALWFPAPGVRIATAPETRRLWRAAPPFAAIAQALAALETDQATGRRLFARAIWERLNYGQFPDQAAKDAFVEAARAHARAQGYGAPDTPLDPYIGPRIREILQG